MCKGPRVEDNCLFYEQRKANKDRALWAARGEAVAHGDHWQGKPVLTHVGNVS